MRDPCRTAPLQPQHPPQPLITLGGRSPRRQHVHLVAPPNRAPRKFHAFRAMPFEIQPERPPRRQRLELSVKLIPQGRVLRFRPCDQIRQSRHVKPHSSNCTQVRPTPCRPHLDPSWRRMQPAGNENLPAKCRSAGDCSLARGLPWSLSNAGWRRLCRTPGI